MDYLESQEKCDENIGGFGLVLERYGVRDDCQYTAVISKKLIMKYTAKFFGSGNYFFCLTPLYCCNIMLIGGYYDTQTTFF